MLNLDPVPGSGAQEPAFEPAGAPAAPAIQLGHVEPAAQHAQLIEPLPEATDQTHDAHADDQVEQVSASLPLGAPPPLEPAAPIEFPRDAMRALDSIDDFALPPRSESSESSEPAGQVVTPPGSLTSQPVVSPEITAQQAVPQQAPQPGAADQIIAGTAGAAAVAGLGAARFGALKLDFDLELPPSPAQAVPTFTPEEVARIARNKLDLAVEYIDLGDVVGARTLINEVIESNDADSRADARALLSTLAPLS
ncbi:FimV/HubP family polar landmark protein [Paraburkholderia bengalensis]